MFRIAMAVAAAAALASACNGSDKAAIIASCAKDGENQKTCECIATELEKTLDKEVYHAIALGARDKQEEADKILKSLPAAQQLTIATGTVGAALKCVSTDAS